MYYGGGGGGGGGGGQGCKPGSFLKGVQLATRIDWKKNYIWKKKVQAKIQLSVPD